MIFHDEWDAGDFLGDWWKEDPDNWTDQQREEAYRVSSSDWVADAWVNGAPKITTEREQ